MDFNLLFSKTKELTILVAEDYQPLRDDLAEVFRDLFKRVEIAEDGEEALRLYMEYITVENRGFDIVITDIQMPRMNGIVLCEELKKINPNQEIMVLSAHTDSEYLIELINCGISQFINKPIEQQALMKAILNVTVKKSAKVNGVIHQNLVYLGEGFNWNKKKCELSKQGQVINLTRYEYLILILLIEKNGQICTNEDLIEYFNGHELELNAKSIRNFVFKLRKKLSEDMIQSVYGMGYKLNAIL